MIRFRSTVLLLPPPTTKQYLLLPSRYAGDFEIDNTAEENFLSDSKNPTTQDQQKSNGRTVLYSPSPMRFRSERKHRLSMHASKSLKSEQNVSNLVIYYETKGYKFTRFMNKDFTASANSPYSILTPNS